MKDIISFFLILFTSLGLPIQAQEMGSVEKSLGFFADVLVNASKSEHRQQANDEFLVGFEKALRMDGAAHYPFDSLKWISQITAPDSSIRVFSWQLMISPDEHLYFGFIQSLRQENDWDLIRLSDRRPFVNAAEYADYDAQTWYGALYYDILLLDSLDAGKGYILLGFHANDSKTNIKLADVMQIDDGNAIFSTEAFYHAKGGEAIDRKKRILIEYSDFSNARLRYDASLDLLIFDHIIPYAAPSNPEGPILVADGSYEAYKFKDGKWMYEEKVFHHIEDEAPRPFPILEGRSSKDIFGRDRE